MKKLILVLILLWGGGALGYWYYAEGSAPRTRFRTATIRKADIASTIHATGTIEPEEVVDVGAQVAGEILSFGADPRDSGKSVSYGTHVEKGTVLARLDDSLFKARLDQAQAQLLKAEAEVVQATAKLKQSERDLERNRKLQSRGTGMVAVQESDNALAAFETSKAALQVAESGVEVAKANLEEATANLRYTTIVSPVKGVILDRRVNIGQTVVASLNAPSLFLIAKDLSRMEIWASVNEADIGSIRVGQPVRFSVSAHPGETFTGSVTQIRLNASMMQNVVTYTVVVAFENTDDRLLPYLTARLEFEVKRSPSALLVPRAALRWKPRVEDVEPSERAAYRQSLQERARADEAPEGDDSEATLWMTRGDFVRPVKVRSGVTDGVNVEVRGDALAEGDRVVIGTERLQEADETSFLPHTRAAEKGDETKAKSR